MTDDHADGIWLKDEVILCPSCQQALYCVDVSPMRDDWVLYCDTCANCVYVSYYDPVAVAYREQVRDEGSLDPGWPQAEATLRLIERRLKSCSCGGRYRYDAARRCPYCLTPVLIDESWAELWPGYFWVEGDDDPTPEQSEQVGAYMDAHKRESDLWQEE